MDKHLWEEINFIHAKAIVAELPSGKLRLSISTALLEEHNTFYLCQRCRSVKDRVHWIPVRPCNDVLADDVMKS